MALPSRLVTIALLGLTATGAVGQTPAEPVYEVFALQYGVIPSFPVRSLVAGAPADRRMDISMMVWLLVAPDRKVLVDAGFYRDRQVTQWRVRDFVRPSDVLARVNVRAEEITDIIITHMHWDHAGSLELFPNARVWVQRAEFDYYTAGEGSTGNTGVDRDDVAVFRQLQQLGRLMLVDGDAQSPIPGIRLYTGGRHTFESQYAGVRTRAGTVIIASDNLYLYENLEQRLPIAQTFDRSANLRAQERMLQLAATPRLIVPGHDPAVFTRFPRPGNGVARIE
jgi:glyoxylase-like metal-dependent hydrolase (beta-lactamase superfamily II)